jgi:hypothetical protein
VDKGFHNEHIINQLNEFIWAELGQSFNYHEFKLAIFAAMKNWCGILVVLMTLSASAQRDVRDSVIAGSHLTFSGAVHVPGGDLSTRFGNSGNIGLAYTFKTRTNWFLGADLSYIFGGNVDEPGLLSNLLTDAGEIIDNNGMVAKVLIQERGFTTHLTVGRLWNVVGPNPNCGLFLKGGVGFMQHKIRLEHQENPITQLEEEYLKGYDRMSNGLSFYQFAGYYHMGTSRLANFVVGVEMYEGFTQGRRDWSFDTQSVDDQPRFDVLMGLRAGWIIHIYSKTPQLYYFD